MLTATNYVHSTKSGNLGQSWTRDPTTFPSTMAALSSLDPATASAWIWESSCWRSDCLFTIALDHLGWHVKSQTHGIFGTWWKPKQCQETPRQALKRLHEDLFMVAAAQVLQPSPVCLTSNHGNSSDHSVQCFQMWRFQAWSNQTIPFQSRDQDRKIGLRIHSNCLSTKSLMKKCRETTHASPFSLGMPVKRKRHRRPAHSEVPACNRRGWITNWLQVG